jgi:hypothetical protein
MSLNHFTIVLGIEIAGKLDSCHTEPECRNLALRKITGNYAGLVVTALFVGISYLRLIHMACKYVKYCDILSHDENPEISRVLLEIVLLTVMTTHTCRM